ncbi:MAG TPA: HAMP domain-containing histidine kinase [Firmicutes bacterium]|nr:HAMP domain-containing histidine kinase [Bacillota bacterium]
MKNWLKNKPLAVQIWIILGLIMGLSFIIISLVFPLILRMTFTKEIYDRLFDSQNYLLEHIEPSFFAEDGVPVVLHGKDRLVPLQREPKERFGPPFRVIRHLWLTDSQPIPASEVPEDFSEEIQQDATNQVTELKYYTKRVKKNNLIYLIRKVETAEGRRGYLVSYVLLRRRDNLIITFFRRTMGLLLFVLAIGWIASIYIARYLTKPLTKLQADVREIAAGKWDTHITLDRKDEIGRLGEAIDWLRGQLLEQNEKQQSFLQQVSHELKTPVMVIRSYAQAIFDGIFPKGNLGNSVKVIEKETYRLEKNVGYLLNLTKYDYFSTRKLEEREVDLAELLKEKIDSFKWRRTELEWNLHLEPVTIWADKEKLLVALENLLDNQVRYARKVVKVKCALRKENNGAVAIINLWNDGPPIDPEVLETIFEKFKKGDQGHHGLGLAIVHTIIRLHQGTIRAANEAGGVAFELELPMTL